MIAANIDPALIRKSELFSSLRQDEIDFVISFSDTLNLPKKELLFSSGEKASHFYILISGEIRVYKRNNDGSEEEMAQFTSGDIIGEFDFVRGAEYDADAEAVKNSQLIVFPGFSLTIDSLAQKVPHMICDIQLNAIMMMTGRIKSIRKLILENMSWVKELHRRAYEDSGTGLWKQVLINDEIRDALNDPTALIILKPDRFKLLVDSRGHSAGDEVMIRIAAILKNFCRRFGQGWPLRFKSNEVGVLSITAIMSPLKKRRRNWPLPSRQWSRSRRRAPSLNLPFRRQSPGRAGQTTTRNGIVFSRALISLFSTPGMPAMRRSFIIQKRKRYEYRIIRGFARNFE